MGKLLCLMGKSSSGKDTIYKKLKEARPELKTVVPYTTRPIRQGEIEGREYHFITIEQLEELRESGKVIEERCYQTVHGPWHYLTVDDGQVDFSHGDYLYIGTLEVYQSLKKYYATQEILPIYIEVDDGLRLLRAVERERNQSQPKYAELCRRFLADEEDFSKEHLEEAGIERVYRNEDLRDCLDEILRELK